MSGHVPSFIRKGDFVLYKGKRRKVELMGIKDYELLVFFFFWAAPL